VSKKVKPFNWLEEVRRKTYEVRDLLRQHAAPSDPLQVCAVSPDSPSSDSVSPRDEPLRT
jgi:hypothetical protein